MDKIFKQLAFVSSMLLVFVFIGRGVLFADVGDIGVYREETGGADVDEDTAAVWHDELWDTTVHQDDTEFTIAGDEINIDLATGGKYFVWYNLHLGSTVGNPNERTEHLGRLSVEGSILHQGYGQGYERAAGNELEVYISGGTILEAAAGDDLKLEVQNTSTEENQGVERRPNLSGIQVLKLDDDWKYFRAYDSSGGTDYNNNEDVDVAFSWDATEEVDDIYMIDGAGTTITLGSVGHYLLTYNMRFDTFTTPSRITMFGEVTVEGSLIQQCSSGSYMRGEVNGNSVSDGSVAGVCIIETDSADEQLQVRVYQGGEETADTDDVAGESGITIVKLPDEGEYLRIYKNTRSQNVSGTNDTITWDAQHEVDSASFTHSIVTNTGSIEINSDGDYLFTGCTHSEKPANDDSRYPYIEQWNINGITQKYGATGAYNRGGHGGGATQTNNDSANCTATLLPDLTSGDEIEYAVTGEDGFDPEDNPPEYLADEAGITAVRLDSLFTKVGGTTDVPNGTTVRLAINGTLMSARSDVASGAYSITVGRDHFSGGDIITVWADGVADTNESTAVTYYKGFGDITGLTLEKHKFTIGSNQNRGVSISDLGQYDNDDDEDIMYLVVDGSLVVDANDVYTDDVFVIATGNTFT